MGIEFDWDGSSRLALLATVALTLVACGGPSEPPTGTAPISANNVTLSIEAPPTALPEIEVAPTYHLAPVILDAPPATDSLDPDAAAEAPAHSQTVPGELSMLSTRGLTLKALVDAANGKPASQMLKAGEVATPMAVGTQVITYTPAQIRAAYGLPSLPAANVIPTAAQAAQLGAGQTIYIVDAYRDPNVAQELTAFNQRFGLPSCTTVAVAPSAGLPIAPAPVGGCTLSVVYATSSGAMTSIAPAYDASWATEIALDVQWAHAIAPFARIVLIEAPDATLNNLLGAVTLANRLGPGIVSMSFGANEGSWTTQVDSAFAAPNMTYLAATGDSGAAVSWPSVSANVLAVGGTSLSYTAGVPRAEIAWANTGGNASQFVATPAYQNASVPGMTAYGHRAVADVAFNADPATGQYLAVINPGAATPGWVSAGGTSLSTPQWAGLIAITNAIRAQLTKGALGQPHAALYGTIASNRTTYASVFADITSGTNGSCATCIAKIGYDTPTGLGTPNVTALLNTLAGMATIAPVAPVVRAAPVTGTAGTPLSFTVSVTAPGTVAFSLSAAPAGMSISAAGVVSWASPVAGSWSVTVTARDPQTGLSGVGVYGVTITAPQAPAVTGAAIKGVAGTALSFNVAVNSTRPLTYALAGAPTGMTIAANGVVSWPVPVVGTYTVTARATDTATGLSGSGVYTINISAPPPPLVPSATLTGVAGSTLTFTVPVSAPNAVAFTLLGAPSGMSIAASGVVTWPSPVAGNYSVTVVATDTRTGLTGRGTYSITIAPPGPVIRVTPINGVVGRALSGTFSVTDATSNTIAISITGVPYGMVFTASGSVITAYWSSPVVGNYALQIQARDGNGRTASATLPITVTR